ncbi:SRPBCC domain-containing protein [Streptomyces sp. KR55]|uniref:SRPBCC domain-containing protein n=1 Tax=Streptomyces sp. KR55 TaxID=3457425 RepID=UPI003FD1CB77
MIHGPDGQPRTGTYMDYLVPTSSEIPDLDMDEIVSPSPMNGLGVKGLGEGGAIAPQAVLANAVEDALRPLGVVVRRGPLPPSRVRSRARRMPELNPPFPHPRSPACGHPADGRGGSEPRLVPALPSPDWTPMQLDHSFTVAADPDDAWKLFHDLARVAPCMLGAVLDTLDGDTLTGRVKVKVGAVQMSYRGSGTVRRDEPARRLLLDLTGSETRGAGTASAVVTATLTAEGSGTRVRVRTDLDITGRPAQFGRGIMTEVGDRIVRQFADRPEDLLREAGPVAPASATAPAAASSASAEPEAVDLGAAALPVLLRKAAGPAAAVLLAVVVVRMVARRARG